MYASSALKQMHFLAGDEGLKSRSELASRMNTWSAWQPRALFCPTNHISNCALLSNNAAPSFFQFRTRSSSRLTNRNNMAYGTTPDLIRVNASAVMHFTSHLRRILMSPRVKYTQSMSMVGHCRTWCQRAKCAIGHMHRF